METDDIIARISQKLKAQGIEPRPEKIASKINRLVTEFGVPPSEAERTILQDTFKEHGIEQPKPSAPSSDAVGIGTLVPGEWVTVEGKVVSVTEPPSPAVAQTGVIADDTGAVRFVIFAKNAPALLKVGEWFRLESAVVDEFRGLSNLKIHAGTTVTPINEDRPLTPEITRIADLRPGIASVTAKIVQDWEVRHDRMLQTGLLGDESGTVKFVIWKGGSDRKLEPDTAYTFAYVPVEEYNGRLSLTIDSASCTPVDSEIAVSAGPAGSEEPMSRFEGKIISVRHVGSETVRESGIIDTEDGAYAFTVWDDAGAPPLEENRYYAIEGATKGIFRGAPRISINQDAVVIPVEDRFFPPPTPTPISDLTPGIATVRVKLVKEWEKRGDRMFQSGLVGDETGIIKFVIWDREGAEQIHENIVYTFFYASVEEYNGRLSLDLTHPTPLPDEDADITLPTGSIQAEESLPLFEGKIISVLSVGSETLRESGVIATADGAYAFTVWADAQIPVLEKGNWYAINGATKGIFKGAPRISLNQAANVTPIEDRTLPRPVITPVSDLTPGIASVRVKLVREWESRSDRMLQSGIIGDETDTVKFVIWDREGAGKIQENLVYTFYHASVEVFNDRLSLDLTHATPLPDEDADIEVSRGGTPLSGALVHIASGSGIVKRCPVEGCSRVLSRQNFCPVHEFQPNFRYDLRIRGTLDDGHTAHNLLIQREAVEGLFSMTLAEAQDIAENQPLGADEVARQLGERALGRYLTVTGREFEGLFIANEAKWLFFDPARHTALINRAGGDVE